MWIGLCTVPSSASSAASRIPALSTTSPPSSLMFETIYHLGIQGYRFFVLGTKPSILPGKEDAVNIWQFLKHGLGLSPKRAQEGHFSFAEKLEYWAVIWGTVVMGITGFMLWNPILTTRLLAGLLCPGGQGRPRQGSPACRLGHPHLAPLHRAHPAPEPEHVSRQDDRRGDGGRAPPRPGRYQGRQG